MREKLIELLRDAAIKSQDICLSYGDWGCGDCPYQEEDTKGCRYAIMVDLLIANDVTMRAKGKWAQSPITRKYFCTNCGQGNFNKNFVHGANFCPVCSADMRGESSA